MAVVAAIDYFSEGHANEYWWDVNTPGDATGNGCTIMFTAKATTFDTGRTFKKVEWDFNDSTSFADGHANPQTAEGIHAAHRFPNGTSHTIDVTVTDDNGTTDTDTLNITVANLTITGGTNAWYVKDDGSDANTGASDGQALQTIQAALDKAAAAGGGTPGTPFIILLKRGDTFTLTAALAAGISDMHPGFIIDYGTASDPMPTVRMGADLSGKGDEPWRNDTVPASSAPGYGLHVENIRFVAPNSSPSTLSQPLSGRSTPAMPMPVTLWIAAPRVTPQTTVTFAPTDAPLRTRVGTTCHSGSNARG